MAEDIPDDIHDAAAIWVERLKQGLSPAEERELAAWLGNQPVRHEAFKRAEATWERSAEATRASVGLRSELAYGPWHLRRGPRIAAAAVGATFLVGLLSVSLVPRMTDWSVMQPASAELLSTHLGEIKRVVLGSGTDITLDTASELRANGPERDQHFTLTHGRARVEARGRSVGPLMLSIGSWTVAADEAVFDADLIASTPRIWVKDGVVRISRPSGASITLRAGEGISGATPTATPTPGSVDDWTSGTLPLRLTLVSEAIDAINRYNERQIVLDDPAIGEMRMTGGFRVRDPLAFARAVASLYGLQVDQSNPATIRLFRP